jgi:hypothetical protein
MFITMILGFYFVSPPSCSRIFNSVSVYKTFFLCLENFNKILLMILYTYLNWLTGLLLTSNLSDVG